MYSLIRPLLFCMDPEAAHDLVMNNLARASANKIATATLGKIYGRKVPSLPTRLMGIEFANPVGLAAGLDKQGSCANAMHALGFGWTELGTVTPQPQSGNAKPRMFRLTDHNAIINRMGFNSIGLDAFLTNVQDNSAGVVRGMNIGKNAATPMENATDDYLIGLTAVYPHSDYVAINISSPNTSNLRELQQDDALDQLLGAIDLKRNQLADQYGKSVPIVLKIAPDLATIQIEVIAGLLRKHHIDAVAATNTTIGRDAVIGHIHANETGGLSGEPVREPATAVIRQLFSNLQGEVPIIGIGGIDSAATAMEKIAAGASLVQLYTGFIYRGPRLIHDIVSQLQSQCGTASFDTWRADMHSKI